MIYIYILEPEPPLLELRALARTRTAQNALRCLWSGFRRAASLLRYPFSDELQ